MQTCKVGLCLLESLFTDCLLLEQGILTIHTVLEELQLSLLLAKLGLLGLIIDFSQQVALAHIGTLLEKNLCHLTRGLESQAYLLIGHHITTHEEFIGKKNLVEHHCLHIEHTVLFRRLRLLHHFVLQILIHTRHKCAYA